MFVDIEIVDWCCGCDYVLEFFKCDDYMESRFGFCCGLCYSVEICKLDIVICDCVGNFW